MTDGDKMLQVIKDMKKTLIISGIIILLFTIFGIISNSNDFIIFEKSSSFDGIAGYSSTYVTYEIGYVNYNTESFGLGIYKDNTTNIDDYTPTQNHIKQINIAHFILTDFGIFILCIFIYGIYKLLLIKNKHIIVKICKFIFIICSIYMSELLFLGITGLFPAIRSKSDLLDFINLGKILPKMSTSEMHHLTVCGRSCINFCVNINHSSIYLEIPDTFIFIIAITLAIVFTIIVKLCLAKNKQSSGEEDIK